jgi:STE24 endopeptidase
MLKLPTKLLIQIVIATAFYMSALIPCFAAEVSVPPPSEQAKLYSMLGYVTYFWNFFFSASILYAFVSLGFSAKLRDFIEQKTQKKWLQCILFLLSLTICLHVLFLPQALILGFLVPHHFNISDQTFQSWLVDYVKSSLLGMDSFVEGFAIFFLLVRKFKKTWPIFLCIFQISMYAFTLFAYPVLIAKEFNTYKPMPECSLRQKIELLAEKANFKIGIPIVIVDASKQTKTINAQVDGFGPSMRIVVWDNALKQMPEDEIVAVLAHEMGHYRLNHIYWEFFLYALCCLASVPINILFARKFVEILPAKWGIRELGDWAITPVIILFTLAVSVVSDPIENSLSRYREEEADTYALKMTGNGPVFAQAMIHLGSAGLSDPNVHPFIEFWLFDHPSITKRVERANRFGQEPN